MPYTKSVQKRLNKLRRTPVKKITRTLISKLTGISITTQVRRENYDYKKKVDVAELIKEWEPVYDNWPTLLQASEQTNIPQNMLRSWVQSDKIDSKKVKNTYFVNPTWLKSIPKNNYIVAQEAAKILDIAPGNLHRYKDKINAIQPAGSGSAVLYVKEDVQHEAQSLEGFMSIEDIRLELEIPYQNIRRIKKPDLVHPFKKKDYYTLESYEKIKESHLNETITFTELLEYCNKHILSSDFVTTKVKNLVRTGSLPFVKEDGFEKRYIDRDTEFRIRKIFKNFKELDEQKEELIELKHSGQYGPLNYRKLESMLRKGGEAHVLSNCDVLSLQLGRTLYDGRIVPKVPVVKFAPNSNVRYISTPILSNLSTAINRFEKCGGQIGSIGWPTKLSRYIK